MKKINLFPYILAFFGVAVLFFYTVSPLELSKIASLWNLLVFGTIGTTILFFSYSNKVKEFFYFFDVFSAKDFLNKFAVGIVWGVIGLFLVSSLVSGAKMLTTMFGSIPSSVLASVTTESALFVLIVQPLSETFLIVTVMLLIATLLKKKMGWNAWFTAIVFTGLLFSLFHFATYGKDFYAYSLNGFLRYLFDLSAYGTVNYHGGFTLMVLGMFWLTLAVLYEDFVVPMAAHIVNNLYVLFFTAGLPPSVQSLVMTVAIVLVLVLVFNVFFTKLSAFDDLKLKNLGGA